MTVPVEVVQTVEPRDRDNHLHEFTYSLGSSGFFREAVDLTGLAGGEVKRAQLLAGLLSALPADILAEVIQLSRTWQNEPFRTVIEAYGTLKARPWSNEWTPKLSALLVEIEPNVRGEEMDKRQALTDLLLPLFEQLAVMSRLPFALEFAETIDDDQVRARVLRRLAAHLGELEASERTRLWPLMIHKAATRQRRDLLSDLSNLSPMIYRLGSAVVFSQAVEDVMTACRWWA